MLKNFGQRQQQILQALLLHKKGLTVDELVRHLGVTRTAVHQHIVALERDAYIHKASLNRTGGRPGRAYVLTEQGIHLFPKHYALFSELLIKQLRDKLGSEALREYLQMLGKELAQLYRPRVAALPVGQQRAEVVAVMQELGYEAHLQFSGEPHEAQRIVAHNCVYHHLAAMYEEVCSLDIALLEGLLGSRVSHQECMLRGGQACHFVAGQNVSPINVSFHKKAN